jgi:hypothetical protein
MKPEYFIAALVLLPACSFGQDTYAGAANPCVSPECTLIATDSIDVMQRPDSSSNVWGNLLPPDSVVITGRTADGWLGFDPGVAQAANLGSFRLRWLHEDGPYDLTGSIGSVPVVWGPEASVPYAMYYEDALLYLNPDTLSAVVDSVSAGFASAVVNRTPGWYLLNLENGPEPGTGEGWIQEEIVSINGDIGSIPELDTGENETN